MFILFLIIYLVHGILGCINHNVDHYRIIMEGTCIFQSMRFTTPKSVMYDVRECLYDLYDLTGHEIQILFLIFL